MSVKFWKPVAAVAVVAAIGVGVWLGRDGSRSVEAVDPATLVPEDATAVAWVDSFAEVADGLRALARKVPGTAGVVEAAELLLDVPSLDEPGFQARGLTTAAGAVLFLWRDAWWLVTSTPRSEGAEHLATLITRRGHPVKATALAGVERAWAIGKRAGAETAGHMWLNGAEVVIRLGAPAVALARGATPAELSVDDIVAWREAKRLAPGSLAGTEGVVHARWTIGEDDPVRQKLRESLGPATLLFGRYVSSFISARADLGLEDGRASLQLKMRTKPGGGADVRRYHHGYLAKERPRLGLGAVLPDETMALARVRINPNLAGMVAGLLRFAGGRGLGELHASLSGLDIGGLLLSRTDGQLAVALLGLTDEAVPDPRAWRGDRWRKQAGIAVALSMKTDTAAKDVLERIAATLHESKVTTQPLSLGAWQGYRVADKRSEWALLRRGMAVLCVIGDGELKRFERVRDGRFPGLASIARANLSSDVVVGKKQWLGGVLTTGRLVRSARRRGIPDSITAMIASIESLALGVELLDDGMVLRARLEPAPTEPSK